MFSANPSYHGLVRKAIVSMGRLFSDIKINRYDNDGILQQVVSVPVAYAPKEKWIVRLDSDPNLTQYTYTNLPRLSFEIVGYTYDATRKLSRMQKVVSTDTATTRKEMFTAVPYNLDINLYALTKTAEDGLAIVEQILPAFTPEYTLSINAIPEMGIQQDIPFILNSVSVQDDYDGDFTTRRFVTHTFNFTAKINLYGNITTQKVINNVTTNIVNENNVPYSKYNAQQNTPIDNITENWNDNL